MKENIENWKSELKSSIDKEALKMMCCALSWENMVIDLLGL